MKAPPGMLRDKFGPVWIKTPGLDSFLSIFQVKKYVVCI